MSNHKDLSAVHPLIHQRPLNDFPQLPVSATHISMAASSATPRLSFSSLSLSKFLHPSVPLALHSNPWPQFRPSNSKKSPIPFNRSSRAVHKSHSPTELNRILFTVPCSNRRFLAMESSETLPTFREGLLKSAAADGATTSSSLSQSVSIRRWIWFFFL